MKNPIGVDAAKLAGLQIDMLQKFRNGQITVNHLEWFNKLSKRDRDKLSWLTAVDDRFILVKTFTITVPENYNHLTALATFKKEHGKKFYYYNENTNDENFKNVSAKLTPGQKLTVKVFGITERMSSEDCLAYLKSQKAIFTGAQGVCLVFEQKREELPKGKWYISFDEKKALWKDSDGDRGVPYLGCRSDGDFNFVLGDFDGDWHDGHCLLCFCDFEESLET